MASWRVSHALFELLKSARIPLVHDFERLLLEFGPRREYGYQFANAFAKLTEERSRLLREPPGIRDAHERMSLAATVVFSTRIAGYSSLEAELSVGSLQKLAGIFDGNFESFRVFLDAFVPVAFADVFNQQFADVHEFSVQVPPGFVSRFNAAARLEPPLVSTAVVPSGEQHSGQSTGRERAEWLWKLANGSLLVPVLLALAVMWFGLQALSGIYRDHRDAMKPVLEHQLLLLQEDRERLGAGMTPVIASEPGTIDYAAYTDCGDPNLRSEVVVNGSHLKSSGATDIGDCETRMPSHPDPSQRTWVECREIKSQSGTMYHIVAEHGAAFDYVEIRIRGEDGKWTPCTFRSREGVHAIRQQSGGALSFDVGGDDSIRRSAAFDYSFLPSSRVRLAFSPGRSGCIWTGEASYLVCS